MTVGAALRAATRRLAQAGIEAPRRNVEWMLGHLLDRSRAALYAHPEDLLPPACERALEDMLERRARREPLQYVIGEVDFLGLRLRVTPDVLIPRPETEQVALRALALLSPIPGPRVLDLCTGSGCIALALREARPDAEVAGVDVSGEALEVAEENGRRLGLDVDWIRADVRGPHLAGRLSRSGYDLIVANPPYVGPEEAEALEPEVRDFEPALALFTGEDPLEFYRAIAGHASSLLRPSGWLVFEVHADRAGDVRNLLAAWGFEDAVQDLDLAGLPRIVWGRRRPGPG